jgi:hypothetical protein
MFQEQSIFLVGSILHADELSITVVPAAANFGALNDVSPPAEKKQYLFALRQL